MDFLLRISLASVLLHLAFLSNNILAAPQQLDYTYDDLGRLTFVEDRVNGNRDYDYDAAGNRCTVAINVENDDETDCPVAENPYSVLPVAPQALQLTGPFSPIGGYSFSWLVVPGALSYQVGIADGSTIDVQPGSDARVYSGNGGAVPLWVRAVNNIGPGPKTTF